MSSLFASLNTASNALDVLGEAIGTVQNNVSNSSTPGYVTQSLNMTASPFDALGNLWGGVRTSGVDSARNVFAEQAVWSANEQVGQSTQQTSSLSSLQSFFDVSGTTGIPAALSSLYSAFSAWSSNPTDSTSRQQVITAATNFAQSVQQTASNVDQLRSQTDTQLSGTVDSINSLTSQIAGLNGEIQHDGGTQDAGVQAQLYSSLEQLSNLAPITVTTASDGTATVLLGGQSPLVLGDSSHALQLSYTAPQNPTVPGATPDAQLLTDNGQDVTGLANQGQLGGLLSFRNQTIPSIIGNSQQQGSLNQLAQGVADRVNTILTGGQISAGPPAVAGQPLFSYSSTTPTEVAGSLSLDPSISASTLAAIAPGPPAVANGVAAELAGLSDSQNSADQISGLNYTAFYSGIASGIGQNEATASANQQTQSQVLTQAQNMRAQVSGVSLNQQAALIQQYQQSYQAAAQVISVVNSTIQTLLTTMQQVQAG
jgi:flagellar hook-associated protein 1 FlgK